MNAKQLRQLLDTEEKSYKEQQKIISELPSTLCCEKCGQFVGVNAQRWSTIAEQRVCLNCKNEFYRGTDSSWNSLSRSEKIHRIFTLIYDNVQVFRKLCRWDDDIWDHAITDRIENFAGNFTPEKGILFCYLKSSVAWYAIKAANLRAKYRAKEITCGLNPHSDMLDSGFRANSYNEDKEEDVKRTSESVLTRKTADNDYQPYSTALDQKIHKDYVEDSKPIFELLESLSPFDHWLIEQHIINGFSQEELANKANRSKATINVWISRICAKLRLEHLQQLE